MTVQALEQYYDENPYQSHPFVASRPERLEGMAKLFGLRPTPPAQARVLELGCASGGNILPVAARYPGSQCVGVDLSARQIASGQQHVQAIGGLDNLTLRHGSITDIDASWGQFDYIICHGVYSWVPPEVQDAILRVAHDNLTPNGVALISYNTYPGWKAREVIRDAMLLRAAKGTNAEEKIGLAKGMVEFLDKHTASNSLLAAAMKDGQSIVGRMDDYYLKHEFLEPYNAPCYLQEFVARADAHGLAYLGDSQLAMMFLQNYAREMQEPLSAEIRGDHVQMEQYLDFVTSRTFRQTLLVRKEHAPSIRRAVNPPDLESFWLAGKFSDIAKTDNAEGGTDISDRTGNRYNAANSVVRGVTNLLNAAYPAPLTPAELEQGLMPQGDAAQRASVREQLDEVLRTMVVQGSLDLYATQPPVARSISLMPLASDFNRRLAAAHVRAGSIQGAVFTTQVHNEVTLDAICTWTLAQLDGAHDFEAIVRKAVQDVNNEVLTLTSSDGSRADAVQAEAVLRQLIPNALATLRANALLVA